MISSARKKSPWMQFFWIVCFFIVIMFGFWRGYDLHDYGWFYGLILTGMAGLNGFYNEGLRKIGFWPQSFKSCFSEYGKKLFGLAVLILLLGFWFGIYRHNDPVHLLLNFREHLVWGLFQQYVLNGFFVNRLAGFFEDENNPKISWSASGLFALAHAPNWFLMLMTFFGGWACAKIYLKHRNLYFLGLAHAVVGFLLYLFVPDSIGHHFIVGPKYFQN